MNRDAHDALNHRPRGDDPDALPPALAESAEAIAAHARTVAPDAAFAARLEARLLAQHTPPTREPRGLWLAALFRPVGRLAWVGLVALLAVGLTLMFRALSQGEAQPAGGRPTLPAPCQPVNAGETPYINFEGGYCVMLSSENPVRQEGARTTVMSAAAMENPNAGSITIEHEAARGRSAEQLFEEAIAPRSIDPSLWTVSEVPFAGGTALLRSPATPDMNLGSELFSVVGERAYHLFFFPGSGWGVDADVWDRVLTRFSVLPEEALSALAACPIGESSGTLVSVHGYCVRYPNGGTQGEVANDDRAMGQLVFGFGSESEAVVFILVEPDGGKPLGELLTSEFPVAGADNITNIHPTSLGGIEALAASFNRERMRQGIVARVNGHIYYLWSNHRQPSEEAEILWQLALDSFTFVPPLVTLEPAPPRETPTPAPIAAPATAEPTPLAPVPMPVTATPAPTPATGDPERFPITGLVRAPAIKVDGVSPDGQWVTYWELSEPGGMSSTGMLVLSDSTGTTICTPAGATTSRDNIFAPQPWLPDGRYVYGGEDGSLRLLDTPCGEPRIIAPAESRLTLLSASADGQQLVLMGQDRLWLWREGAAEPSSVQGEGRTILPGAAFSPDGHWLAVQSGPTHELPSTWLTLFDSAWSTEWWTTIGYDINGVPGGEGENRPGEPPLWLDNERLVLMVAGAEPEIVTVERAEQPLSRLFGVEARPDMAHSVQFNGSTLLWVRSRGVETELHRYDLATGEVTSSVVSAASLRALLAPNSADLLLIEERPDSESRVWVQRASGEIVAGPAVGTVVSGTWAPDGTRYAVGSSEGLTVVELGEGGEQTITPLTAGRVDFLHWAPDGGLWALVRVSPEETRLLRVEMER